MKVMAVLALGGIFISLSANLSPIAAATISEGEFNQAISTTIAVIPRVCFFSPVLTQALVLSVISIIVVAFLFTTAGALPYWISCAVATAIRLVGETLAAGYQVSKQIVEPVVSAVSKSLFNTATWWIPVVATVSIAALSLMVYQAWQAARAARAQPSSMSSTYRARVRAAGGYLC
jgi:hypothetical protein